MSSLNNSDSNPKVTVVIPTYRRPHLLTRAIESILGQSYQNFCVRIYDNASGDETRDVVADYARHDARITYICNSENIGALKNVKQGLESVETEFYSLLSDDDFLLPDFFDSTTHALEKYFNAGFACSKTVVADVSKNRIQFRNKDWKGGLYEPSHEVISKMFRSHFVSTGVLFRREMMECVGKFDSGGNDIIYLTMAAATRPFVVVDNYGAVLTLHPQTYSAKGHAQKESFASIYKMFVSTSENLLKLNVPDDRKAHLLALITNLYLRTLEYMKVQIRYFDGYGMHENSDEILPLPTRLSVFELTDQLFRKTPKFAYPALKTTVKLARKIRELIKRTQQNKQWVAMPESAQLVMNDEYPDVTNFVSALRKVDPIFETVE